MMKNVVVDQAGCLEDTPLLPQRVKKRLDSRLRSPLPSVEEPCPLSLPYGLLNTQPDPLHTTDLRMLPMKGVNLFELLEIKKALENCLFFKNYNLILIPAKKVIPLKSTLASLTLLMPSTPPEGLLVQISMIEYFPAKVVSS